jgi:hypothetical protein
MIGALVERTTDRQRRYGTAASKTMQVADQFGRPQAQKITAGATIGVPLRLYERTRSSGPASSRRRRDLPSSSPPSSTRSWTRTVAR